MHELKKESPQHIEVARKMAEDIIGMSPSQQNEVLAHTRELVQKNRAGEIEHRSKELEELKHLYDQL